MKGKHTTLTHIFVILFFATLSFRATAVEDPTLNILMFVAFEEAYYSEYVVMYRALEAAGYNVDVRSSDNGTATTYMVPADTDIVETAISLPGGSYGDFTQQFQDLFGAVWDPAWDSNPGTIPVSGRIQDVVDMSGYDALVVVGGTGAIAYQVDGTYADQGAVPALDVQAAAERLNALALDALANGKPVLGQCHGASVPLFWRVPGTSGPAEETIGYSILKGGVATGFPEAMTPVNMTALDVVHRANDRVTVTSPHSSFDDGGNGEFKIITTRDWYPQTVAHAAQTLLNIVESYPSQQTMQETVSTLIIHGGAVDVADCSAGNRGNDIPCNYGIGADTPADFTDVENVLTADSPDDDYAITVTSLNISGGGLPYDPNDAASISLYLSQFDTVVYFKHWSTDMTNALQNALVSFADNGGGVLAMHHAAYNDIDGALNKDILVDQLMGVESAMNTWSGSLQNFTLFATNHGHFVSTYGVSFDDALPTPGSWAGNLPPSGASMSFSTYPTLSIYDEIYNNLAFAPGQFFGNGVNAITPIFSNDSASAGQVHTAGFVKRFDPSADGSVGGVAYFAAGERKESVTIAHPYGQVIRNAIVWLANIPAPLVPPVVPENPTTQHTGDEFDNSATLSEWQRNFQTENWGQDQLELLDIDVTNTGALTMMPYSVVTWEDRLGPIVYKSVAGDFVVTTSVTVTNRTGDGAPTTDYSLAGPMVRWPQAEGYDAQSDFASGQQTLFRLGLGRTTSAYYLSSNVTTNSVSTPNSTFVGVDSAEIRLARIGDVLISLYRLPEGDWQVWDAYSWSGMPNELQVGLAAQTDWAAATAQADFDHNNTVTVGNPDLLAQFDFVRFDDPVVPDYLIGTDLAAAADVDLLSFLGYAGEPAVVEPPALPEDVDPLYALTDEFDDNTTVSNWSRLYETENWNADPLLEYDVDTSEAGALTMVPSASSWWEDRIGALRYREVTGDFIVSTNVRVSDPSGVGVPSSFYSLAGLMARVPQAPGYDAQTDFANGQQNYYDVLLGFTTTGPQLLVNLTQASNSGNPASDVIDYEIEIRLARVGDVLITLFREPGSAWQVLEAVSWPELAPTLQVGMAAFSDWAGANSVSVGDHNNTAVAGNEDLSAAFDYMRFQTPVVPAPLAGLDLTTVPSTDLLSFLGFDSTPGIVYLDVTPPTTPTNLIASNTTEISTDLTWDAVMDATTPPVTYTLYRDGVPVQGGLESASATVVDLESATTYSFSVSAADAVGNTSVQSDPIDVHTASPEMEDPLRELDDEFDNAATLANWQRLYQHENWHADPLTGLDIDTDDTSALTMIPSASSWWYDRIGALCYKEVSGDFVISTNIRVTDASGTGAPASLYSLAGLMARVPQAPGYDAQLDFAIGQQNYYDFLLGFTTSGPEMLYNHTQAGVSENPAFPVGGYEVEIRLARLGDVVISLYREPGGAWQVNEAVTHPGLADTLQVGIVAFSDWYGADSVSEFDHNNTAVAANEDLRAQFDYIRFRTPVIPPELAGQDLTVVEDATLLGFLGFDSEAAEVAAAPLPWSDPATWGGAVPIAGETVTIPADTTIVLDQSTPDLGGLTVMGTLVFDNQDLELTADWIVVSGALHIGSEAEPFQHQATITLTGDDPAESIMGMGTRGIMVMGGVLELHGQSPTPVWTKINQHAEAGDDFLYTAEPVDWAVNDEIVLAPTDFYGVAETERYQIATAVNADGFFLDSPVAGFRWGLMQYATDLGMSLTPDGSVIPPAPLEDGDTPLELDERAEVGNLTRNIVIQGADDALWQNDDFGAHVMIMMLTSQAHIDGVEFRRVGQAGRLGRYPFHWHRLSYNDAGYELGDAEGHYIRNSSIHDTRNRAIVIHGTNGVTVQNNVCYDILGHGIFFEDAVERRNTVENNLVLRVRFPQQVNALKLHEISVQAGHTTGSSGIWVSNPDNTVRNNTMADAEGFGMWMAFPAAPVGVSANVPLLPFRLPFGDFDGNTMHSNQRRGVMLDESEMDNDGNVVALQYASTTDGEDLAWPYDNLQRFTINGWTLWKNGGGNFWNRVVWPTYEEFVSADGEGKFFSGSGSSGLITRSLIIGHSLNNLTPLPNPVMGPPVALATYHSAFDMRENVIINFPFVDNQTSGAFATDDYYIRPVEKGQIRNPNNLLINSHPGYRSDAAVDEDIAFNFAQGFDYYVFAGALWDPHGTWGAPGNWSVYDMPFLTHNANCVTIEPASQDVTSCDGEYYGVNHFVLDQGNLPWDDLMAIHVTRLDENAPDMVVGEWHVDGAQPGWQLAHMRHFAARQDGIYLLDFPESAVPSDVSVDISNMHDGSDTFVLGIRFSGSEPAQVYSTTYTYPGYFNDDAANAPTWASKHDYAAVMDRQAVQNSIGETYWQDIVNDIVWIKVTPADLVQFEPPPEGEGAEFSNAVLYNEFHLRIW